MYIRFNGEMFFLPHSETLIEVLHAYSIDIQTRGIAVAVNGRIIYRADWGSCLLKEGDQIEVVHAVQGG